MPAAKTPSIDGIPVEYYKSNSESLAPRLAHLYNNYINNGCLPPFLQTALLKIIPKPGKPVDKLDSYCPLSMLCNQYKILAGVLANRLKKLLPDIISPLQTGFVPGREMIDNALYMKLLFEHHQIGEELGLALFLDFKSAFDMVNHDYLIDTLHAFGFGPWFIAAIKTLLNSHKARIELNDGLGPPFDWTRGVFQGCPIAPLLFIITLEPLIHRINQSGSKGIRVKGKEVRILAAADDTVILAQDEASLQDFLQILEQYQQASGAQLNLQKTIGANLLQRAPTQDFGVNWLDKTTNHKYLGFSINSTGFSPRNTFEEPIKKLEERLGFWTTAPITLRGRVLLAKALMYSLLWYRTCVLDMPPCIKKTVDKAIWNFIWSNKIHRVRKADMVRSLQDGGWQALDLDSFLDTQRAKWLLKMHRSSGLVQHPWTSIIQDELQWLSSQTGISILDPSLKRCPCTLPTVKAWIPIWRRLIRLGKCSLDKLTSKNMYLDFLSDRYKNWPDNQRHHEHWHRIDWPRAYQSLHKLALRPAIRQFFYLVWRRAIATNDWLHVRTNKAPSPNCPHCNVPETIEHALLFCPKAHLVLQRFTTYVLKHTGSLPLINKDSLLLLHDHPLRHLFAAVVFNIWKARNEFTFKGTSPEPEATWRAALCDFGTAAAALLEKHGTLDGNWLIYFDVHNCEPVFRL